MFRFTIRDVLWLTVVVCICIFVWNLPALAQDSAGQPVLIEGSWTHQGMRDILGRGTDTTVVVKKEASRWTITFNQTTFPSVNDKDAKPISLREGPYEASVHDQELVFTKDGHEVRNTFLCDTNRLVLPAIVQKKPGEWVFTAGRESFIVKCEHDPFKVPAGKAVATDVLGGKGFYSYEEAPRSSFWPRAQYLRVLERNDEKGQLFERYRLIFDDYGSPRYEAILQTGERSRSAYQLRIFLAKNKEERGP